MHAGIQQQVKPTPISSAFLNSKIELPSVKALKDVPEQGWRCSTETRPSQIPGAGNGRYATETVKAGSAVVAKPLVPMSTIDTLASLPNDVTITFANVDDLEKYIRLMQHEGGHSREVVIDLFENFIYGFDGRVACLNVTTWTVNHGDNIADGLNVDVVEKPLPGGATALVGQAMIDIQVNDELYMDYRKFKLPGFYVDYTRAHGFKDVRTLTLEAAYGSAE